MGTSRFIPAKSFPKNGISFGRMTILHFDILGIFKLLSRWKRAPPAVSVPKKRKREYVGGDAHIAPGVKHRNYWQFSANS